MSEISKIKIYKKLIGLGLISSIGFFVCCFNLINIILKYNTVSIFIVVGLIISIYLNKGQRLTLFNIYGSTALSAIDKAAVRLINEYKSVKLYIIISISLTLIIYASAFALMNSDFKLFSNEAIFEAIFSLLCFYSLIYSIDFFSTILK